MCRAGNRSAPPRRARRRATNRSSDANGSKGAVVKPRWADSLRRFSALDPRRSRRAIWRRLAGRGWAIGLSLSLAACALQPPRLSKEPATLDGMLRVEHSSPGVLLINPDFEALRHRSGSRGPIHLQNCRVAFEDPFQADRLPGLETRIADYLCSAVRRHLSDSGRELAEGPPRDGDTVIDAWLINVRVVAPRARGWGWRSPRPHQMAFAMRVRIQGVERDYLRFYRAADSEGLFEGAAFRPNWDALSGTVDALVHTAWRAFERSYQGVPGLPQGE